MFAQRLRELRTSRKLSQQDLADIVGKTQQAVNLWEKGENEPGYETLKKLADLFSVTVDYLLGRTDDPSPKQDDRQHVNDDEALEYLDELHKRPEMKALFQVSRKATKEDIETAITIIEALKKKGEEEGAGVKVAHHNLSNDRG